MSFTRIPQGDQIFYHYEWRDRLGQKLAINFPLTAISVTTARAAVQRFDNTRVNQKARSVSTSVLRERLSELKTRFPDVQFDIDPKSDEIRYSIPHKLDEAKKKAIIDAELDAMYNQIYKDVPNISIERLHDGKISWRGTYSEDQNNQVRALVDQASERIKTALQAMVDDIKGQTQQRAREVRQALEAFDAQAVAQAKATADQMVTEQGYVRDGKDHVALDYRRHAQSGALSFYLAVRPWHTLLDGLNERARIERLLSFFQTIPYDRLEDRRSSSGAGFAAPAALIDGNRGDCDTKSVAFAALFHALTPDTPIILVMLKDHALLGLGITPSKTDQTIAHGGRRYVLVEPTGPRQTRVGEIDQQTRSSLGGRKDVLPLF